MLGPGLARATEYETFIDIDDEDDLLELNTAGDISAETFDTLVELLRRGVDLNTGKREDLYTLPNLNYAQVDAILRYREEVGFIHDPAMLVVAGVIDANILKSIAPFIYIVNPGVRYAATSGYVRLRTAYSPPDRRVPATVLDSQVSTLRHLTLGFAGTVTRQRVGDVRFDPDRDALSADAPRPRVVIPKFFAQWDTDQYSILAGTYRAGFGQRLTFDNTRNPTPNGIYRDLTIYPRPVRLTRLCKESAGELGESPCTGETGDTYVTPDFRWQETLQGLAAGVKQLKMGSGWLQAYAFMSLQSKSIYQYSIYDPSICDDPRLDSEDHPQCKAPTIYQRQPSPLSPASSLSYQKLPRMYRDTTAGGNVSYFFNRRSWVGVTGYGTTIKWQTGGKPLDFQESARVPFGGPFGAVGINGAWGKRWSDLGVEVARSFDSMATASGSATTVARGGGGFAAIMRHTATWGRHQLETSVRYYDRNYANPYARPIAGRDLSEGQSARDEAGFRLRYAGRPTPKTNVRGTLNFWVPPSSGEPQIHLLARIDHVVTRWFLPGLWLEARDKDLRRNGWQQCYGTDPGLSSTVSGEDGGDGELGDPDVNYGNLGEASQLGCRGESIKYNIQSAFTPHRKFKIVPRFQHRFVGDPKSTAIDSSYNPEDAAAPKIARTNYRQDISLWLTLTARPTDALRLRGRVRYQNWAIKDNTYLEQSLWSFIDAGYLIRKKFLVQFRYDLFVWLDKRPSTLTRIPSPEHRLMATLEGRF